MAIFTLGSVAAGVTIPKFLPKDETKVEAPKPVAAAPIAQSKEDDFDLEKFIKYVSRL
ncbi:MAG: ATP synthase subunit K family protein [Asgard group archaeon]|nr:ATP synthase subunit K family protein [Asgard group archaeon]